MNDLVRDTIDEARERMKDHDSEHARGQCECPCDHLLEELMELLEEEG